jgi:hypothetical protein
MNSAAGLGSVNISYHFGPNNIVRGRQPFVTAGYDLYFRAGTVNAGNVGAGINMWLRPQTGLRLELRGHGFGNRLHFVEFRLGLAAR